MKRLFAAALLAPTLITSAAAALYSFPGDAGAQYGYAAVYGADGTLLRVVRAELSDGTAEIDTADGETVKLILPDATILPGEKAPEPTAAPTSKSTSKPSKYDKYKDQVDPKDLKDALSIAGKVDAGYILGLTSGGLTSEERSELKKYLMSRLSSSEISRGIQLFAKYSYLL